MRNVSIPELNRLGHLFFKRNTARLLFLQKQKMHKLWNEWVCPKQRVLSHSFSPSNQQLDLRIKVEFLRELDRYFELEQQKMELPLLKNFLKKSSQNSNIQSMMRDCGSLTSPETQIHSLSPQRISRLNLEP